MGGKERAGREAVLLGRKPGLWRVFGYALLLAAAVLFFCSKSSVAYPINDWCDANVYYSAGKGMLAGKVMYRDLYDHKGPLIYGLHALCAWVCPNGFAGVYVLEVLAAAAFLTAAHRLMALYGGQKLAPLAMPLLALAVYASWSFQAGDSAEELSLPLTLIPVCDVLAWLRQDGKKPPRGGRLFWDGLLFGCVFWMKFTLCGPQGAALLLLLIYVLLDHGAAAAAKALGYLLLGFLAATLPWAVYFGASNAVGSWLKTYLYDNLFLYSQGEEPLSLGSRGVLMLRSVWAWITENPLYAVPVLLGGAWCVLGKGPTLRERLVLGLSLLFCGAGAFITGRTYPYYALSLAAFAPVFFLPLAARLEKPLAARLTAKNNRWLTAGLCLVCVGLCPALCHNVRESFGMPKAATMQYQFAAVIDQTPGATLLNYGFMDAGFYTAANIAPTVKYFHQANVPLQEMLDEQERYIADGVCDYVVTRGKQPERIADKYDLVATADSPPGFWYEHVYLYRKRVEK